MISFACVSCGRTMRAPDGSGGRKGRCAACGAVNVVPMQSTAAPPIAAAAVEEVISPADSYDLAEEPAFAARAPLVAESMEIAPGAAMRVLAPASPALSYASAGTPQFNELSNADPNWRLRLQNASSLMLWSVVLSILSACVRNGTAGLIAQLIMAAMQLMAAFLISTPEPGIPQSGRQKVESVLLRVTAAMAAGGVVIAGLGTAANSEGVAAIGILLSMARLIQTGLFLWVLRGLALRIPSTGLAVSAIIVMVGFPASVGVILLAALTALWGGGGAAAVAPMVGIVMIGVGGIVGFGLFYIVVLLWFRHALP